MAAEGPRVRVLNKAISFRDPVLLPATRTLMTYRSPVRQALARSISRESLGHTPLGTSEKDDGPRPTPNAEGVYR
jgi:hypothetical protein